MPACLGCALSASQRRHQRGVWWASLCCCLVLITTPRWLRLVRAAMLLGVGQRWALFGALLGALGALIGTAAASSRRVRTSPPASKATGRRAASRASIQELVAAVEGGGGVCHVGYGIQPVEGCGDGVVAQVPIPEGAAIVDVPIELCAVSSAAEGEGGGSAGVQLVHILLDVVRQGQSSPLATYLHSLPRTFSEPAFWRPGCDEMLALAGSRLAVSIAADQRAADQGAAALVAALRAEGREATVEQVLWAKKVQQTRAFEVTLEGRGCYTVMVPLIDMANHSFEGAPTTNAHFGWSLTAESEPQGGPLAGVRLQMVASRAIAAGEQVMIDYDQSAEHAQIFQRYGVPLQPCGQHLGPRHKVLVPFPGVLASPLLEDWQVSLLVRCYRRRHPLAPRTKDATDADEWRALVLEREDMTVDAEGFGFMLMDMLRIVALEQPPGSIETESPTGSLEPEEGEGQKLEPAAAHETAAAFAMLADVLRGQLLEYTRFAEPAEPSASVRLARNAVEYERAILLRKLGEVERSLESLTGVRARLNSAATAEAVAAMRERRAALRKEAIAGRW